MSVEMNTINARFDRLETMFHTMFEVMATQSGSLDNIHRKINHISNDVTEVKETQVRHERILEGVSLINIDLQELKKRLET